MFGKDVKGGVKREKKKRRQEKRRRGKAGGPGACPRQKLVFCRFLGLVGTWEHCFRARRNEIYHWMKFQNDPSCFGNKKQKCVVSFFDTDRSRGPAGVDSNEDCLLESGWGA